MTEQEKKRQVAKISVFITSIFVIFLSISYAFINQTLRGTKRQVIISGNLQLELKEGEAITLENTLPMYDEVGMLQESFEFKLINKTNTDTNYTLKLVDITSDGVQKLDTSYVKYGLIKGEENSKIDFLSELNEDIIDKGIILGNETIDYALRLWIDASVEDETLIQGKSLSYRINVVADQEIQVSYKGMMESRQFKEGGDVGEKIDTTFYVYKEKITSIVFENEINIPNNVNEDLKWDVSEKNDESVMAYLENISTDDSLEKYKLHLQANGKIYANIDSTELFSGFSNIEAVEGWEYFDTSYVTNMSYMFAGYSSSQPLDLSKLDTSNVTDMAGMFSSYRGGVLTIENWDTSKVTNMNSMFYGYRSSQPLDLSKLDTSNVTDMSFMFSDYSGSAPLDLSNLNTSSVTDMSYMFSYYSSSASLDLSNLNTSNITDMSYMFDGYSSSQPLDLSKLDTSNVTDMAGMFSDYSGSAPLDLSNLNTSSVTDMSYMFSYYSSSAPLNLSNWNTSNVTDMSYMFSDYSGSAPLDLSNLNTSSVTDMSYMFSYCSSSAPLNLSNWNTSNVTDMSYMFNNYSSSQPLDLSNFNTSNVTNMNSMFSYYSSDQPLDLSNFDTSKVTDMFSMFSDYSSSAVLDISSFNVSKVTDVSRMFVRNAEYYASPILVKDEAMKMWVLEQNSNLTNITIKGVSG